MANLSPRLVVMKLSQLIASLQVAGKRLGATLRRCSSIVGLRVRKWWCTAKHATSVIRSGNVGLRMRQCWDAIQRRCAAWLPRQPKTDAASMAASAQRSTRFRMWARRALIGAGIAVAASIGVTTFWVGYLLLRLPSVDILQNIQFQVPLQVYTLDRKLVAEFGEKRRVPVSLDKAPKQLVQAILAAEDERFYEHPGVDWKGLARAIIYLIRTGEKGPGGSTITMQVARNFFLGREKTYQRKLNEILLALKIENRLQKNDILHLYINKVFLGHRAYGFGAAAKVYYGKALHELDLPQLAMIAGLPKAPSRYNPVINPSRSRSRRNYVLRRMFELGYIDDKNYEKARKARLTASIHRQIIQIEAPYVAEMVRTRIEQAYGKQIYTVGLKVYTTIDSRMQTVANAAVRKALQAYDQRHGYRGAVRTLVEASNERRIKQLLQRQPTLGGLRPGIVTEVDDHFASVYVKNTGTVDLPFAAMKWARPYIDKDHTGEPPQSAHEVLSAGDMIYVQLTEDGWVLTQIPAVEGALVALSADDGSIAALVGGFDFYRSKFNRVTQARRQPGSSFKPFIYSAAIKKGYSAATLINDAPIVIDAPSLPDAWRPENYSGKFFGPTRLREALYRSRNLVSIRILRDLGLPYAIKHLKQFGFDVKRLPKNLSLALGSGEISPLELASGYAVLANGGYRVAPYFIHKITSLDNDKVYTVEPVVVCPSCAKLLNDAFKKQLPDTAGGNDQIENQATVTVNGQQRRIGDIRIATRVLDAANAWIVNSMLRDVIKRGTGRKAKVLQRNDLAGKTGTTNDQRDAWFSGFNRRLVAIAWVGFDQFASLGQYETGGRAALPIWINLMREALRGKREEIMARPEGVVTVRIDPTTGELASTHTKNTIFEIFRTTNAPKASANNASAVKNPKSETTEGLEQLF